MAKQVLYADVTAEMAQALDLAVERTGKSIDAIVEEALTEWFRVEVKRHAPQRGPRGN